MALVRRAHRRRSWPASRARGIASPLLTAAVWVVARGAPRPLCRSAGSRGATSASRCTTFPARALASFGGVALVTFVVVAVNGLLLDLVLAGSRARSTPVRWSLARVGARRRARRDARGGRRHAVRAARDRAAAVRAAAGQRPGAAAGRADNSSCSPTIHLALADRLRGHYDLIVFPESRARHRSRARPVPARASCTAIAARARRARPA